MKFFENHEISIEIPIENFEILKIFMQIFENHDRNVLTSKKYFFDRIFLMKIDIFFSKPMQKFKRGK